MGDVLGQTPLMEVPKLAEEVGCDTLYLKREDKNPSGSFKDRSIPPWIESYLRKGYESFVISSSGNAAISALNFAKQNQHRLNITVFIPTTIPTQKAMRLFTIIGTPLPEKFDPGKMVTTRNMNIVFSRRAKSDAQQYAKKMDSVLLRSSVDDHALVGYEKIVSELKNVDHDALFTCCSSGASILGLFNGYQNQNIPLPRLCIVQTEKVHPIAKEWDSNYNKSPTSLCNAVSDKVAHRKDQVTEAVKKSKGFGFIVSNSHLKHSRQLLETHGVHVSYDGACSFAGLIKANEENYSKFTLPKRPICIISGA